MDRYPGDRVTVGEISLSTRRIAAYYGDHDELHLSFNFPPLLCTLGGRRVARRDRPHHRVARSGRRVADVGASETTTRCGPAPATESDARARAAAVLVLTLRGTPFLYAGDELGLEDAVVRGSHVLDPGGRDGCRAPIPWDPEPPHGWDGATPWLPFPPHAGEKCAVVAAR